MPELTVGQLIEHLQATYPMGLRVLVDGYEAGYQDPVLKPEVVVPVKSRSYWQGTYMPFKESGGPVMGYINALIIGRTKIDDNLKDTGSL